MTDSLQTTVKCQDSGDGTGDVIIDLSTDVLAALDISLGDLLTIELVDGSKLLKPIRDADTKPLD